MHGVIGRRIDQVAQGRAHETRRVVFVSRVSNHIKEHLPHEEQAKGDGMNGHEKYGQRKDGGLDDRLPR